MTQHRPGTFLELETLDRQALPYRLVGVSALEVFFGVRPGAVTTMEADLAVTDLARVFETLRFPGLPRWDLLVPHDEGEILIRSNDGDTAQVIGESEHPLLQFSYDPHRRAFSDPHELYPLLKEARQRMARDEDALPVPGLHALEAALLCSRFPFVPAAPPTPWQPDLALPAAFHRLLLSQILTGPFSARGLELLRSGGYLDQVLPELALMDTTDHSKEGHPEGNVWRHTVETMRYRKRWDLRVSLALLLHDAGKPYARPDGVHRFANHADIGADLAGKILGRLEFPRELIRDVQWLIRHHMMPGALERLPEHRRDPVMSSELFPRLLEVYRCDLSSTYRGPDGYYRACRVYRSYLKHRRRQAPGLMRLYVE